jgi:hypothetical protein
MAREQLVMILSTIGSKTVVSSLLERVILPLDIPRLASLSLLEPNLRVYFSMTPLKLGLTCSVSSELYPAPNYRKLRAHLLLKGIYHTPDGLWIAEGGILELSFQHSLYFAVDEDASCLALISIKPYY